MGEGGAIKERDRSKLDGYVPVSYRTEKYSSAYYLSTSEEMSNFRKMLRN